MLNQLKPLTELADSQIPKLAQRSKISPSKGKICFYTTTCILIPLLLSSKLDITTSKKGGKKAHQSILDQEVKPSKALRKKREQENILKSKDIYSE